MRSSRVPSPDRLRHEMGGTMPKTELPAPGPEACLTDPDEATWWTIEAARKWHRVGKEAVEAAPSGARNDGPTWPRRSSSPRALSTRPASSPDSMAPRRNRRRGMLTRKGLAAIAASPYSAQCRREDLNLHPPLSGLGPEPSASASSATSAMPHLCKGSPRRESRGSVPEGNSGASLAVLSRSVAFPQPPTRNPALSRRKTHPRARLPPTAIPTISALVVISPIGLTVARNPPRLSPSRISG